jgi:hypothetical protein
MTKPIARLTLHRMSELPKRHRKKIASWLRRQAEFLEKDADKMSARFTARYFTN